MVDVRQTAPVERRVVTSAGRTIIVARHAGYCYGVQRALRMAKSAACDPGPPIATLGPLIHNPGVVDDLAQRGVRPADSLDDVAAGSVIVRTHGVPPHVVAAARERGLSVLDATCPFVRAAQKKAARLRESGRVVVILGERRHPEVLGIAACAGSDAVVVESADELRDGLVRDRRVGIVVQTTQTYAALSELAAAVAPLARETLIYNTICEATEQRQEAAREMAREVDCVLVVGGRNSANTRRLADVCRGIQPCTHHIERATEVVCSWLRGCRTVGVTGGASTPQDEIDATVEALSACPDAV